MRRRRQSAARQRASRSVHRTSGVERRPAALAGAVAAGLDRTVKAAGHPYAQVGGSSDGHHHASGKPVQTFGDDALALGVWRW